MIVGSIKEDLALEKRVSITPETAKNIKGLGLKVLIEKNYATHLGIEDNEYEKNGVEIKESSIEVYDTLGINLLYGVFSEGNSWKSSNKEYAQFQKELPSPSEFYFLLANECNSNQGCNIQIAREDNNSRINLILDGI